MKITVTESLFLQSFKQVRPDQFSRAALVALFEYLEEVDRESGSEMELDVIALCCDWTEYANAIEAAEASYASEDVNNEKAGVSDRKALEYLNDETTVLEFEGGVLVLNF